MMWTYSGSEVLVPTADGCFVRESRTAEKHWRNTQAIREGTTLCRVTLGPSRGLALPEIGGGGSRSHCPIGISRGVLADERLAPMPRVLQGEANRYRVQARLDRPVRESESWQTDRAVRRPWSEPLRSRSSAWYPPRSHQTPARIDHPHFLPGKFETSGPSRNDRRSTP